MTPKTIGTLAAVAGVSFLILGISPALAQQYTPQQSALAIQMAQAAQSYANNVLSIGQQHGLNVTKAQSLISQGDQLLAKAQGEASTNSTQAVHDALAAMRDYHAAVTTVMSEAATLFQPSQTDEIQFVRQHVAMVQNRTAQLQSVLTKSCAQPGASNATCTDARSNLATVSSDLSQLVTLLASPNPDLSAVKSLVNDIVQHMSQVEHDINQLAQANKAQWAIHYIQTNLEPRITQLQQEAQKANLSSSVMQQVQSLLSNAQTDFSNAIQDFQSGNMSSGVQSAQQGIQLIQQVQNLIQQNAGHK